MIRVYMRLTQLGEALKHIFLPPFSESDVMTLVYLVGLAAVEHRSAIASFVTREFFLKAATKGPLDQLYGMLLLALLVAMVVMFVITVWVNAFKERTASFTEKRSLAFFFYLTLSLLTIFSLSSLSVSYPGTGRDVVEGLIFLYLLLRSLGTLLVIYILSDKDREHIYADRMTNQQLSRSAVLVVLFGGTVAYLLLRPERSLPITILLGYFYVTLLILLYEKIVKVVRAGFHAPLKK